MQLGKAQNQINHRFTFTTGATTQEIELRFFVQSPVLNASHNGSHLVRDIQPFEVKINSISIAEITDYQGFTADVQTSNIYYPFGMQMPGRIYSSKSYRYGYQGQESDPEIYGEGNSYAFKYRMSDPRLGRFWSVDPLASDYPHNSPYAFSENRVIDGIELEGLEYKSAAKWANDKLTGWKTDWGNEETYNRTYWGFSHHRNENYQAKIKKTDTLQCIESCHFAYANGNKKVYDYLKESGYYASGVPGSHSRKETFDFFRNGGEHHSLIDGSNATSADVGDMVFYQNNDYDNPWKPNAGHATIMGSKLTINDDGQLTFTEYSINADGEKFGERTVTFDKDDDGNWIKSGSNYQIQGFGRVDEDAINQQESE